MFANVYVIVYVMYNYMNDVLYVWTIVKSREYDIFVWTMCRNRNRDGTTNQKKKTGFKKRDLGVASIVFPVATVIATGRRTKKRKRVLKKEIWESPP